jgi:hypothetical protein
VTTNSRTEKAACHLRGWHRFTCVKAIHCKA